MLSLYLVPHPPKWPKKSIIAAVKFHISLEGCQNLWRAQDDDRYYLDLFVENETPVTMNMTMTSQGYYSLIKAHKSFIFLLVLVGLLTQVEK